MSITLFVKNHSWINHGTQMFIVIMGSQYPIIIHYSKFVGWFISWKIHL